MIYALVGVGVVVLLFLLIVSLRPSTLRVTRSVRMAAPAADVFARVNDFHKWVAWSPWEKMDPDLKRTYEGAASGKGAIYSWVGNKKVGEGRMTLTESRPPDLIRIKLEFIKPFKCTNEVEFTFKHEGYQTYVTWTMTGKNNFMAKAMGLFMNMDKMIGKDFEAGLANLEVAVKGK